MEPLLERNLRDPVTGVDVRAVSIAAAGISAVINGGGRMRQRAIPLFIPPAVRPRSVPEAQRFPVLSMRRDEDSLDLAVSRVDHSGRSATGG